MSADGRAGNDGWGATAGAAIAGVGGRLATPRAGEVAAAALTLAAVAWLAGPLLGADRTASALVGGATLGAVVHGLNSDRPGVLALAGAAGAVAAPLVASVVAMGLALFDGGVVSGLVRLATVLALVAAGATVALAASDAPGDGTVKRAAVRLGAGTLAVVALLSVLATATDAGLLNPLELGLAALGLLAGAALATGHPVAAPSLWLAALLGLAPTWLALRRLPVEVLVAPDRRERVAAARDRLRRTARLALLGVVIVGTPAVVVATILVAVDPGGPVGAAWDAVQWLLGVAAVRYPLLLAGGASTLALAVEITGRRLRRLSRREAARLAAPVGSVALVSLTLAGLLVATGTLRALVAGLPAVLREPLAGVLATTPGAVSLGLALVAAALLATVGLLAATTLAGALGVLPDRVAGPTLAAAAIFVTALVAMLAGRTLAALAGAAAAMVVWDAGEAAAGIDAELGRDVDALRAEVVRLGAGTAVGAVAVVGAGLALTFVAAVAHSPASESLAVVGVVLGLAASGAALLSLRG